MHVHLALAADDNYAQHLTVTLYSLLNCASSKNYYHLHILDGGISLKKKSKLTASLIKFKNKKIEFHQIDKNIFKHTKQFLHLNEVCYFRIILPELFPKLKKILYLDADLLIFRDVAEIFKIELNKKEFVAAAKIFHPNYKKVLSKQFQVDLSFCFNTGVLLMNLQAMRKNGSAKKLMAFSRLNAAKLLAADQDVFNIILADRVKKLDPLWNVGSYIFYAKNHYYCQLNARKFEQLKKNPGIIHFDGAKPWSFAYFHPYKKEYYKFLDCTTFRNWCPKFNLKSLIVNYSFYLAVKVMNLFPNNIYNIVEFYFLKNNFLEKKYRANNL